MENKRVEESAECSYLSRTQTMDRPENFGQYCLSNPGIMLRVSQFNKGTSFTQRERDVLNLRGLLPYKVENIDAQVRRCLKQFRSFSDPMAKHVYLISLKERNHTLFYRLVSENLQEMLPIVYTPTVGQACLTFGENYRAADGLYLTISDKGKIAENLQNWKANKLDQVSIVVVTDGSRILGLGDLGCNGMGIPIGKLSLYVACGGFHPSTTLPILIDVGTDNETFLNDEFYLGVRQNRAKDAEYYDFVEEVITSVFTRWPRCLLQFEDFSNAHCFSLLEKYRDRFLCFNDDIQGTGSVVAAGFLNALKIGKIPPQNLKILFCGAGSAAVGVANLIISSLVKCHNIPEDKARAMIHMVDSKGLIAKGRGDELADFKKPFIRNDIEFEPKFAKLIDIVEHVKPHALIGLSGKANQFTAPVLQAIAKIQEQPIVFALSNPTANAECTFESAIANTNGKCIFASGSPFDPVTLQGKTYFASQANNMYIFPGLGFGGWASEAKCISDDMILAATLTLAEQASPDDLANGRLFPPLDCARNVSAEIATDVFRTAILQNIAGNNASKCAKTMERGDIKQLLKSRMYNPRYFECQDASTLLDDFEKTLTPKAFTRI